MKPQWIADRVIQKRHADTQVVFITRWRDKINYKEQTKLHNTRASNSTQGSSPTDDHNPDHDLLLTMRWKDWDKCYTLKEPCAITKLNTHNDPQMLCKQNTFSYNQYPPGSHTVAMWQVWWITGKYCFISKDLRDTFLFANFSSTQPTQELGSQVYSKVSNKRGMWTSGSKLIKIGVGQRTNKVQGSKISYGSNQK